MEEIKSEAWTLTDGDLLIAPRTADELVRIKEVEGFAGNFIEAEPYENMSAGAASTRRRTGSNAFSDPSSNISFAAEMDFKLGNALFKKLWVSSPSSTLASDGLGPIFNSRSCQTCHIKDGRGHPPSNAEDNRVSMVMSLYQLKAAKRKGKGIIFETTPDPIYGDQLQDLSVAGMESEGQLKVLYSKISKYFGNNYTHELRSPLYKADDLNYGDLNPLTTISARVAPQMIGLGLLEAIPSSDIIKRADPNDLNGDGISGIARLVYSDEHESILLGRFGYKASSPTIRHQSAKAMHSDIGLSNPLHPVPWGDCTEMQKKCINFPHGDDDFGVGYEVGPEALKLLTFYSRNLGVPKRVDVGDQEILKGKSLFYETGCVSCHHPKFVTHRLINQNEQSFQLIWPYTDMLLHDMGDGLADQGADNDLGREWRTAPLWGIGLTEQVNGHTYFLHDGRARTLTEAILWHGGEAKNSRDKFVELSVSAKSALLAFLKSL